jgi:hypothetical protein
MLDPQWPIWLSILGWTLAAFVGGVGTVWAIYEVIRDEGTPQEEQAKSCEIGED